MRTALDSRPTVTAVRPAASLPRLIMASSRGPVEHTLDGQGQLVRRLNPGGLSTALASLATGLPITWIANAGSDADRVIAGCDHAIGLEDGKRLRLLAPPAEAYQLFYSTFCNPILWFLQHSLWDRLQRADLDREALDAWQDGYLPVNQLFAEAVVEELARGDGRDRVMLHDYHLYAAPLFIRNRVPSAVLQHFIHVPWPAPEEWAHLPRAIAESICEGLLANDSVVFQTERSAHNFVLTCQTFLPDVQTDDDASTLSRGGRTTRVWWNPISVDVWYLRSQLTSPEAAPYRDALRAEADERTIVRVDRLDPVKNVAAGFRAYGRLLERHPEWRGRARFLAFLVPSRSSIPEYAAYAAEVQQEMDAVNERYGRPGWQPVTVFYEHNRTQALVALSLSDVLLVNPVADGMNLVSKEGPALNARDGVLVLSETAGASAELGRAALPVRAGDIDGTAEALHAALAMPAEERGARARALREAVLRHDLRRWLGLLLDDLDARAAGTPVAVATAERARSGAAS
ncbi:MAG: trehalose-6-phosphate synthase [Chloroflexi bacterium]|nr:trehalose-6-phosphate synthase [Chloroflexota bacterium]